MSVATIKAKRRMPRIFYGWWLLGAGTLAMTMHGGLFAYGFAAFFMPLASALGTSRGALSVAFSFTRLESSLLGPIEGFLIDRFGPRGMMHIGFALLGLSFLLFSRVNSLLGFYLVFPLLALGASMSGFLPIVTAVTNWFTRRRGMALGISASGVNIGGMTVAFVAMGISFYGWRTTAMIIALVVWLFGFPLAAMMRHRPQQYGYLPDGDEPGERTVAARASSEGEEHGVAAHPTEDESPDFTPMQALRTQAFWFIAFAHSMSLLIVGSVTIHEIPLLVDAGLSFETAASVLAFMTFVAMVGRISGGFLGDMFGRKPVLLVCFILMSAGLMVLATAQTVVQALIFAVVYGLGYGARAPLFNALRGDFFGPRNFATITGLSQPVMMIGSFFGPLVAGFAYDVQGSYRMVFTVIALVNLAGGVLVLFIRKPPIPRRHEAIPGDR